jgi:TP901-1 family phage major tail protein
LANEKGLSVLLKVGATATAPTTFTTLEGQTDTSMDGSVNVADITDKDTGGWQAGMATTRSGTVTAAGNLKSPRPMLDMLETAWNTGATHVCQCVFDTAGNGYSGAFYVTGFSITGATTDAGKYSVTLTPAGALTKITVT